MINKAIMTLLGYGDCLNTTAGNTAGLLKLTNDEGKVTKILLDCGYDVPAKLNKDAWPDIICITHAHGDHCAGLEQIAFESKFEPAHTKNRYKCKPILCCSNAVFKDLCSRFLMVFRTALKNNEGMTATEIFQEYFNLSSNLLSDEVLTAEKYVFHPDICEITAVEVPHTPGMASTAFIINIDNRESIYWSGDTNEIMDFTKNSTSFPGFTWIFHEVCALTNPAHCNYHRVEALALQLYSNYCHDLGVGGHSNLFGRQRLVKVVPIHIPKILCEGSEYLVKHEIQNMVWPGPGGINTQFLIFDHTDEAVEAGDDDDEAGGEWVVRF